ncbi:MAG: LysM peptidoglycan-binding domain-containing protein [Desulfovibrionaceae bacterium]
MKRAVFPALFIALLVFTGCASKTIPSAPQETVANDAVLTADAPGESLADTEKAPVDAELNDATDNLVVVDDNAPLTPQEQLALDTQDSLLVPDAEDNEDIQLYFKYFTHKKRDTFAAWLTRSERYLPFVKKVFRDKGLPEELAYLPFVESGYNAKAYSRAGAAGCWQFMSFTGRKYGLNKSWWIDERRDPFKATYAAAAYLSDLYKMFDDWYLALAAYNAGEGKIKRAIDGTGAEDFFELAEKNHSLKRRARLKLETRHYVPKFLAVLKILRNLESLGFDPIDETAAPEFATVTVKGGTDLLALAQACDMEWNDFYQDNRAFARYVSPPDYEATVYLPADKLEQATAFLKKPTATPYAGYRMYRVRSGDSWYRISGRYGVPVAILKTVNKTRSNTLSIGQQVMIPRAGQSMAVDSPAEKTRKIAQKRGNYTVHSGDTLSEIAQRYGVSTSTLMRANGLSSPRRLRSGQTLYIPGRDAPAADTKLTLAKAEKVKQAITYKVRKGDSLWAIARRFGVSSADLMRWNKLSSRSVIQPGDTLNVYR